jgi:hypothetical protein
MTTTKPRLRLTIVKPEVAPAQDTQTSVDAARRRHGQLFAHEQGSAWKKGVGLFDDSTCLTRWLMNRKRGPQS